MTTSCSSPNLHDQVQSTPAIIRTKLQLVDLAGSECVGKNTFHIDNGIGTVFIAMAVVRARQRTIY